eukprot:SAG11_NODE_924_length_6525_cov_5.604264_3_plen_324_part_00
MVRPPVCRALPPRWATPASRLLLAVATKMTKTAATTFVRAHHTSLRATRISIVCVRRRVSVLQPNAGYTGEGGLDANGTQAHNQTLKPTNLTLALAATLDTPIRVIRKQVPARLPACPPTRSPRSCSVPCIYSPTPHAVLDGGWRGGIVLAQGHTSRGTLSWVYDGLYKVVEWKRATSIQGPVVFKFLMRRLASETGTVSAPGERIHPLPSFVLLVYLRVSCCGVFCIPEPDSALSECRRATQWSTAAAASSAGSSRARASRCVRRGAPTCSVHGGTPRNRIVRGDAARSLSHTHAVECIRYAPCMVWGSSLPLLHTRAFTAT